MLGSLPLLFSILVAVPGILIPLYVASRMLRVLADPQRETTEKAFARGTIVVMLLLVGVAAYAALEIFRTLSALAAPLEAPRAARGQPDDVRALPAPDAAGSMREPVQMDSAALALDGEGLRVFLLPGGTVRPVPFGTPEAAALRVMERVRGSGVERGENLACRASYVSWDDGLTVWFVRGRFVGWSLRGGSVLTTASGVGLGSTRAQLDSAYDAGVRESSLGTEFQAGGLTGLLESPAEDARISHLRAGATCVAR